MAKQIKAKTGAERVAAHRASGKALAVTIQHPAAIYALEAMLADGVHLSQRAALEGALITHGRKYLTRERLATLKALVAT